MKYQVIERKDGKFQVREKRSFLDGWFVYSYEYMTPDVAKDFIYKEIQQAEKFRLEKGGRQLKRIVEEFND